jgi:hypothetical protein
MADRNVQGTWTAHQATGHTITFNVFQEPFVEGKAKLSGSASTSGLSSKKCKGVLTNDRFVFTVPWEQNDSVGEYTGTFNLFGRIVGFTVDLTHPENIAAWSSEKTFPLT